MTSRTAVITGGNSGLGYACAAALLASKDGDPWHVVLACRGAQRAQEAADRLGEMTGGRVEVMSLDLASLASIRAFAADLADRLETGALPPVHGLVCNAGVNTAATRTFTADGFETTFGVNHLGHFLLVNLLLPVLQPRSRIAVVASGVHDPVQKTGVPAPAWNAPDALAKGELGPAAEKDRSLRSGLRRYSTSKLANVYFTYALARRLPQGISANAFDPGLMPDTGFLRDAPAPARFFNNRVLPRILPLVRRVYLANTHTAEESGDALARLITDTALDGVSGKYFEGRREIRSSAESYDRERAEELWHASETLTGEGVPDAVTGR